MSYYPHVRHGDVFVPIAALENDVRDLVNQVPKCGQTPKAGRRNPDITVEVYQPATSTVTLLAGTPVNLGIRNTQEPACPVSAFSDENLPYGVLRRNLAPGDVAECILSGRADVKLIGGGTGAFAVPAIQGFQRNASNGFPILGCDSNDSAEILFSPSFQRKQEDDAPHLPFTFREYTQNGYDYLHIYGGIFNCMGEPASIEDADYRFSDIGRGDYIYIHHNTNSHTTYYCFNPVVSFGNGPAGVLGRRTSSGEFVCFNNHYPILLNTQFFFLCPKYNT